MAIYYMTETGNLYKQQDESPKQWHERINTLYYLISRKPQWTNFCKKYIPVSSKRVKHQIKEIDNYYNFGINKPIFPSFCNKCG